MSAAHVRSLSWFAAGVAATMIVTVLFTAWRADAIGGNESTFVPITPCRLVDTRPGTQVGPKSSPIGPNEEHTLQVTGNQGECSTPAAATAVSINLVGVSPTADTFLSIFPANTANPGTAVLNLVAGQAPTPNKLDVKLAPNGRVKVYNRFGSVHIVGDVLGYYRNDGLADLEARLAAIESNDLDERVGALEGANLADRLDALESADLPNRVGALEDAKPFSVQAVNLSEELADGTEEVIATVKIAAPAKGRVVVISTTTVLQDDVGVSTDCSITTGTTIDANAMQQFRHQLHQPAGGVLAGTRLFAINEGTTTTYRLVCVSYNATSDLVNARLTAIFTPAP